MATRLHMCLIGVDFRRSHELIENLSSRHGVILLPRLSAADALVVGLADVVVVDCGESEVASACALVDELRALRSGPIVVLDGGIDQDDIARLLNAGARDYFPEPLNVGLIAERLEYLAEGAGIRR